MSNTIHVCETCQVEGVCDGVVPFEPERESAFAVYWKCPRCEDLSLVISPIGPWLTPTPGMCLQCGQEGVNENLACPGCAILIAEVLRAEETGFTDVELLELARVDFERGTCRRALTLVNYVLRRNPQSGEAWSIKGQFFEYLGFRRALKAAMQEAGRQKRSGGDDSGDGNDSRSWWQFWR